ncbi:MAG TPA: CocE/NonD family hydrolase [Jatrophihabitans sp.]
MRRRPLAVLTVTSLTAAAALGASTPAGARSQNGIATPIPASVLRASAAPGHHWTPDRARFGVGKDGDRSIRMSDGTVLRADVYYPTTNGKPARGPFPVVLTMTPYGKGVLGNSSSSAGDQTGPSPYLVERGFIDVVADVRGTGASQGEFGLFDPRQDQDGAALVRWAAHRPRSTGKVGLYGASYLGIDQLLTAAALPKGSPLKAIFPVVPGNDLYKDTATMGGLVDVEFDAFYLGLTGGLNTVGPLAEGLQNPATLMSNLPAEVAHLKDLADFDAKFTATTLSGGPSAYDGTYWHRRNPVNVLKKIVANGIPAYLVGGEYDLFQRGEPLDFSGLQNAWAGRSVTAPMSASQPVTGRYQLLDGPFTHLSGSTAALDPLMLEWFDTWLKGRHTYMAQTPTPLHYFDLGANRYTAHQRYPFANAHPTRYWFGPNKTLTRTRPARPTSTTLVWSPVGNPCGRPTDQWSAGAPSLATGYVHAGAPCVDGNDTGGQQGPDRTTFTTAPLARKATIAGPIDVTVNATATTTDTEWVAEVEDIAPDGTSTPLTEGALLGSLRHLARHGTWRSRDGQILLPDHTYAKRDARPVVPGKLTRYDLEVFPTYATIAKGHRIRVTLATADTPHLAPTVPALANLAGGVYQVRIGSSAIELPLAH